MPAAFNSGSDSIGLQHRAAPRPDVYRSSLAQQVHDLVALLGKYLSTYSGNPDRSGMLQMRGLCIRIRSTSRILTELAESSYEDLLNARPELKSEINRIRSINLSYLHSVAALERYLAQACNASPAPTDGQFKPFVFVYGEFVMQHWREFRNAWCSVHLDAWCQDTGGGD